MKEIKYAIVEFADGDKYSIINPEIKVEPRQNVMFGGASSHLAEECFPPGVPYKLPDDVFLMNGMFIVTLTFENILPQKFWDESFKLGPFEFKLQMLDVFRAVAIAILK